MDAPSSHEDSGNAPRVGADSYASLADADAHIAVPSEADLAAEPMSLAEARQVLAAQAGKTGKGFNRASSMERIITSGGGSRNHSPSLPGKLP